MLLGRVRQTLLSMARRRARLGRRMGRRVRTLLSPAMRHGRPGRPVMRASRVRWHRRHRQGDSGRHGTGGTFLHRCREAGRAIVGLGVRCAAVGTVLGDGVCGVAEGGLVADGAVDGGVAGRSMLRSHGGTVSYCAVVWDGEVEVPARLIHRRRGEGNERKEREEQHGVHG